MPSSAARPTSDHLLTSTAKAHRLTINRRAKAARKKRAGSLIGSRFSAGGHGEETHAFGRRTKRKFQPLDIERALAMLATMSAPEVAKKTGVSRQVLQTWTLRNKPLSGPAYTGDKDPRVIVTKARARAYRTGENPTLALRIEWMAAGLNRKSLRVYLSLERIALPADFILYADPAAQMRCVRMWNDVKLTPAAHQQPRQNPAQPLSRPAQPARGSVLQHRRRMVGYGFQVSSSIAHR